MSTAYYGLFHAWTWAAATALLGDADDSRVSAVTRWVAHSDVLELSRAVLLSDNNLAKNKANAAKHIEPILARPVGVDLTTVCATFARIQEERHKADYDRDYVITRKDTIGMVDDARDAWIVLWRLFAERDANTVLFLRLTFGSTRIAKTY
ncbi:MAG: hypothetical protein L0I76_15035 [Pseudonocardia sp.]|nr:hypothetical protein [Pseudonocardia sp.]